jgi:LmbE family N-acetylglucosaminyl deacetylase
VRVLAVGAHPDDLEILCGGTLTRFVREGHAVTMCHATRGDRGSYTGTREEVARKREAEACTAAEIAGADHMSLGLSDAEIDAGDPRQRRLVIDLVRDTRPDVIITHAPTDYMSDHNEISKLVFDCSFHATLPLLETERPHHDTVPPVYFMDTLMGLDFVPTEYVDITDTIDTKVAMLEAHASQLRWLREHDGVDIVENMKTVAAYRGLQCSVKYAEAFRPCLTWLRATTRRHLPGR